MAVFIVLEPMIWHIALAVIMTAILVTVLRVQEFFVANGNTVTIPLRVHLHSQRYVVIMRRLCQSHIRCPQDYGRKCENQ